MTGYRESGVDLEAAARAVAMIGEVARDATRPEVVGGVGGFAGLFRIGGGRVLAAATDGVGTKLEIARQVGRLDTVGIDLVAMCADDVVCTGAEPLFFLDYIAVGKVRPHEIAALVAGVAEGCRRAGCALLGGETAEHPGVMADDQFDLAGFCVGLADERELLRPERVGSGDVLVGLASTGLHSNGYSLVRRILADAPHLRLESLPPGLGRPLAEELLEPTAVYAPLVLRLAREGHIVAAAHITGGGLVENVPRMLPDGLGAVIDTDAWAVPPIFGVLRSAGGVGLGDMFSTFNMGIGMVVACRPGAEGSVADAAGAFGLAAHAIGRVDEGSGVRLHGSGAP